MEHNATIKQVVSFICTSIRPFYRSIGLMIITACATAADLSLRPYLFKIILDRLAKQSEARMLAPVLMPLCWYLGASLFMITLWKLNLYFIEIRMIPALRTHIARNTFIVLLNQQYTYYQNNFAGTLGNKMNDITQNIPTMLHISIDTFLLYTISLFFALYTAATVHLVFFFALLGWVIFCSLLSLFLLPRVITYSQQCANNLSAIAGRTVDVLTNILLVRLFTQKTKEQKTIDHLCKKSLTDEQYLNTLHLNIKTFGGYSFCAVQALNIYFLVQGLNNNTVTAGDFSLILTLNFSVLNSFWRILVDGLMFSTAYGKVHQALSSIASTPVVQDHPHAKKLLVTKGEIIFDKVDFSYHQEESLFKSISLVIPQGQKVGLVGYSGSGKSTFINLILRLFDISSGRILIDGQDIHEVTQDSLRSAVGVISQNTSLFNRTLRENIAYGKTDATDKEIIAASKRACAHEFIETLPLMYETEAGEGGLKLSAGERQRITIARTFLKNAPILILDEATSQLDPLAEKKIQESLDALMEGKTTLVIAHRIATLLSMDRIIVFDKGQIVEDGTHHELFIKDGLYKKLWQTQVDGFLPDEK